MKASVSHKNLILESIIPLSSVVIWILVIYGILQYNWTNPMWENVLFIFVVLDVLFLLSIYPIAVLIKCILYDHDTFLKYDNKRGVFEYERKDIKMFFSLSEVKSFSLIRPCIRSAVGTIYEVELTSGCVIIITDLLADTQQMVEFLKITNTYYESVLFRTFYNHPPIN
jgi:hypothetical protein